MKKLTSLLLIGALLLTLFTACGKQIFDGSRTGNDKQFIMDYKVLNKTETHEMKLDKGAKVDVAIKNTSGRLDVFVESADGKEIYKGNDIESGQFTLEIKDAGNYKFIVTGSKAKGSVSFKVRE
jgi:hypothetical protein